MLAVVASLGLAPAGRAEKVSFLQPGRPNGTDSIRNTTAGGLTGLALPDPFLQRIEDRIAIDAFQAANSAVAPSIIPTPRPRYVANNRVLEPVKAVRVSLPEPAIAHRLAHREWVLPMRGFRAPILESVGEPWRIRFETNAASTGEVAAARVVEERLARDGLLPTLGRVLAALGAESCLTNPAVTLQRLERVGFPADLLHHFKTSPNEPEALRPRRPELLVEMAARRLVGVTQPETVVDQPLPVRFDFRPPSPGLGWLNRLSVRASAPEHRAAGGELELGGRFQLGMESGEMEIGLVRMQVGGGWRDGIVPGGSIDVISQMVDHFRSANFLVSVSQEASGSFRALVTNSWRFRKRHQMTVCEEAVEPSAWAQDNGKAGLIVGVAGTVPRPATIVPRYACLDEGKSVFAPGESYLADGWRAAGHAVIHSPLLFQGGNLLGVRDPRSGRRWLVMGDGTVLRNIALGLSRAEVVAAFEAEFGVDEVIVLPGVSYHLDYDVTFRSEGRDLLAFVNDTPAAARQVIVTAVQALQRHGLIHDSLATAAITAVKGTQTGEGLARLRTWVDAQKGTNTVYPTQLSRAFAADPVDDAAGNLQVFLLALDVLESSQSAEREASHGSRSPRADYLAALRRMELAREAQTAAIRQMGCRVIPVPSMQDLYRSVNFLNGIQHSTGFVLPGYGGLYGALDQAAATVFRQNLGPGKLVTVMRTAECQRRHGGIHCTASAYPRP